SDAALIIQTAPGLASFRRCEERGHGHDRRAHLAVWSRAPCPGEKETTGLPHLTLLGRDQCACVVPDLPDDVVAELSIAGMQPLGFFFSPGPPLPEHRFRIPRDGGRAGRTQWPGAKACRARRIFRCDPREALDLLRCHNAIGNALRLYGLRD